MPFHRVAQGEFVAKIARRYVVSADAIWNHPDNADLKARRKTPHVLTAGDQIWVPETDLKTVSVATGSLHRFQVKAATTKVKVRFLRQEKPRGAVPFTATIGERSLDGALDGDGVLELTIPIDTTSFELELRPPNERVERYDVRVGHLDPADDPVGIEQRLRHLGHAWEGAADESGLGPEGSRVLAGFQKKHGLEPTGEIDDATRDKLRHVHGS